MEYRSIKQADYERVRLFLSENGWAARVADAEKFAKMMDNADRTIVAVENEKIVGFARALCDEVSNGYIGTVAVAAEFRNRGIGREMVNRLTGDNPEITWVLRAGRGSQKFWEKTGFKESKVAMEKTRQTI